MNSPLDVVELAERFSPLLYMVHLLIHTYNYVCLFVVKHTLFGLPKSWECQVLTKQLTSEIHIMSSKNCIYVYKHGTIHITTTLKF